jgi:hypothetical protein
MIYRTASLCFWAVLVAFTDLKGRVSPHRAVFPKTSSTSEKKFLKQQYLALPVELRLGESFYLFREDALRLRDFGNPAGIMEGVVAERAGNEIFSRF